MGKFAPGGDAGTATPASVSQGSRQSQPKGASAGYAIGGDYTERRKATMGSSGS
jgi:hypothetical protein